MLLGVFSEASFSDTVDLTDFGADDAEWSWNRKFRFAQELAVLSDSFPTALTKSRALSSKAWSAARIRLEESSSRRTLFRVEIEGSTAPYPVLLENRLHRD